MRRLCAECEHEHELFANYDLCKRAFQQLIQVIFVMRVDINLTKVRCTLFNTCDDQNCFDSTILNEKNSTNFILVEFNKFIGDLFYKIT